MKLISLGSERVKRTFHWVQITANRARFVVVGVLTMTSDSGDF